MFSYFLFTFALLEFEIFYSNTNVYLFILLTIFGFLLTSITYGKKIFNTTLKKNLKNKVLDLEKGVYHPFYYWGHYWAERVSKKEREKFYSKLGFYATIAVLASILTADVLRNSPIELIFILLMSGALSIYFMLGLSIKIYGYFWIKQWEKETGRKMKIEL